MCRGQNPQHADAGRVVEPMPTERYQINAESAISPLEETDILLLSRDKGMEILRSLSSWNLGGGTYEVSKNVKDQQRRKQC